MHVADILLCIASNDETNIESINNWLIKTYGPKCRLKQINQLCDSNYTMHSSIYGTAVNYCNLRLLIRKFRCTKWTYPQSAQLMIKNEHYDAFFVINAIGNLRDQLNQLRQLK